MIKSVVERLMDEIYEMKLIDDNIVTKISVTRERENRACPFTATAHISQMLDISGHGESAEESLEFLKAAVVLYAPNYEAPSDRLYINMESMLGGSGKDIIDLGSIPVYVPDSIEKRAPCGCDIRVELSVRDYISGHYISGPGIAVTPRYNWCPTHLQAYAMRRLLEDELKTGRDWLGSNATRGSDDLGLPSIFSVTDRLEEVRKALGGIVND